MFTPFILHIPLSRSSAARRQSASDYVLPPHWPDRYTLPGTLIVCVEQPLGPRDLVEKRAHPAKAVKMIATTPGQSSPTRPSDERRCVWPPPEHTLRRAERTRRSLHQRLTPAAAQFSVRMAMMMHNLDEELPVEPVISAILEEAAQDDAQITLKSHNAFPAHCANITDEVLDELNILARCPQDDQLRPHTARPRSSALSTDSASVYSHASEAAADFNATQMRATSEGETPGEQWEWCSPEDLDHWLSETPELVTDEGSDELGVPAIPDQEKEIREAPQPYIPTLTEDDSPASLPEPQDSTTADADRTGAALESTSELEHLEWYSPEDLDELSGGAHLVSANQTVAQPTLPCTSRLTRKPALRCSERKSRWSRKAIRPVKAPTTSESEAEAQKYQEQSSAGATTCDEGEESEDSLDTATESSCNEADESDYQDSDDAFWCCKPPKNVEGRQRRRPTRPLPQSPSSKPATSQTPVQQPTSDSFAPLTPWHPAPRTKRFRHAPQRPGPGSSLSCASESASEAEADPDRVRMMSFRPCFQFADVCKLENQSAGAHLKAARHRLWDEEAAQNLEMQSRSLSQDAAGPKDYLKQIWKQQRETVLLCVDE